jgi:hypothetical protein
MTPRLIDQRLAVLANATSPIVIALNGHTGRLTTFRTYQHDVGDVDRSFELDTARVNVATGLSLHLFLMLGANIDTLNDKAAVI